MPEFYSTSFFFKAGLTYAIGGGDPGYTGPWFPNGASAMDGIKALMVKAPGGATVDMVLSNSNTTIQNLHLNSETIYPLRPRIIKSTHDIYGLA